MSDAARWLREQLAVIASVLEDPAAEERFQAWKKTYRVVLKAKMKAPRNPEVPSAEGGIPDA